MTAPTDTSPYLCRSAAELEVWLECYCDGIDAQPEPGSGSDTIGDLQQLDRYGRMLRQTAIIDRGMRDLLHTDRVAWRVLNQYYRQGMWVERRGWTVPARSAGLPVPLCLNAARCRIQGDDRIGLAYCDRGRGCEQMHRRFEELRAGYVEVLWHAIEVRQGSTNGGLDSQ